MKYKIGTQFNHIGVVIGIIGYNPDDEHQYEVALMAGNIYVEDAFSEIELDLII